MLTEKTETTHDHLIQLVKLAAVGELVAKVAHELNNPLTSVLGFSELLLKETGPDDPHRQDLEVIAKEAQRARELARNLLDLTRQNEAEWKACDINQLLQQTLAVIHFQLAQTRVVVEEDYASGISLSFLDENQMKQVFLNLINNAVQAMPDGGTLHLCTKQIGDKIAVSISDTGIGIPPEHRERIFEPFFSTKPAGTGLGLPICQGIVQAHGGNITVESQPGHGSTFTVWLPVETVSVEESPGQTSRRGQQQSRCPTSLRLVRMEKLADTLRQALSEAFAEQGQGSLYQRLRPRESSGAVQ